MRARRQVRLGLERPLRFPRTALLVIPDRAGVKRCGRPVDRGVELQLFRFRMDGGEIRLAIEKYFRQLVREFIAHRVFDDERVGDAHRSAVVVHAGIGPLGNDETEVEPGVNCSCSFGSTSSFESSFAVMPIVLARSRSDAVGRPPLQKNASIFPSLSASTDAFTVRPCLPMSLSGSMPAARSTRNAITSVPLPGEPVETTRPRRSVRRLIPLPSTVATCV